jgi:hypothetical protein
MPDALGAACAWSPTLGAVLLTTISVVYVRRKEARRHAEEERKLLPVASHSMATPQPIVVKISADLIRASAISMGHPRLAIINGQLVSEGEKITIHAPTASVAVTLQVVKISDGQIELSDGVQIIKSRLELAPPVRPKP